MKKKQNLPLHPWAQSPEQLLKSFQSSENGLTSKETAKRLDEYGLNEISRKEKRPAFQILLAQLTNPLVFVLIIASIIAFFLGEKNDAIIILAIILINAILGFTQEYRAEKTVRALRKLISQKATVLRDGKKMEIDAKMIVPGDIVHLGIGDIVPADIRLFKLEDMSIDESSLTGESVPVIKTAAVTQQEKTLPQYLKNMAFMGTHIIGGEGYGLVISTGESTFFGKTASYLKEPETISDFEKSISNFSGFLLKVILAMTLLIFIVNAVLHHGLLESFLFALALAVGITPEALPVIITISLSKGARLLAQKHVIVKKLSSIEDLGNMDILCTDKTGTLTEGKLALENFLNPDHQPDENLIIYGLLCNDAVVGGKKVVGNLVDRAIWESGHIKKVMKRYHSYRILDQNEFDFHRRRMSVVAKGSDGKSWLIVKGSPESIQDTATRIRINGRDEKLTKDRLQNYLKLINNYRKQGYTTIGIAVKEWNGGNSTSKDECDLTIAGFLIFMDPPRSTAKTSIRQMEKLGVEIKVLSGDDPLVTEVICRKVGLEILGGRIYTGDELDLLNDAEFAEVVEKYNVFSRITPEHKYRIVKTLNTGENRTIAFIGDGINDAPAIKIADVGISVNTATDIAKEAADIILLQQSLGVIVNGIIEGRRIFTNITKYILNTISANYGNMFTMAASSFFLKFIPLLPSQILLNNLVTDTPMVAIAGDNIDSEMLKKPKKLDIKMIRKFMSYFGLISTVFDMTLILTLLFVLKAEPQLFRTAWFFESALSEVVVTFAIRTQKPFYRSMPSRLLLGISAAVVIMLVLLVYTPIGNIFEFVTLNTTMILFIIGIVAAYFTAAEIAKKRFFRKYAQ
jgi:P-type Mg2+ transporter